MRKSGFTLIEILVTIAISALLVSFALASYVKFNQRQIVDQAARQIFSDLRLAQNMAVSQEKPTSCSGTLTGFVFNVTSGTDYHLDADCSSSVLVKTGKVSSVSVAGFSSVKFLVLGGSPVFTGGNTLTVSGFGNSKTITIGAMGEIQLSN